MERAIRVIYHINVFNKWANTVVYTADDGLNPYSVCHNDIGISQAAMAFDNCVQDYLEMSLVPWRTTLDYVKLIRVLETALL